MHLLDARGKSTDENLLDARGKSTDGTWVCVSGAQQARDLPSLQLRPLAVRVPVPEVEGEAVEDHECPICLDTTATQDMLEFQCGHSTCSKCYHTIINGATDMTGAVCPLCRSPLMEVCLVIPPMARQALQVGPPRPPLPPEP